jgi:hypothetical protein
VVRLSFRFVDMLDGDLALRGTVPLRGGECTFLLDIAAADRSLPVVLAASARVEAVAAEPRRLRFRLSGPVGTEAVARLLLPAAPTAVWAGDRPLAFTWDADTRTVLVQHANVPEGLTCTAEW